MGVWLSAPERVEPPLSSGSVPWCWPRQWLDRERLLEAQHDALEAVLRELLAVHGPAHPAWGAAEALAYDRVCRRLLWDLRLHLRLEERWLLALGSLCPGHQAAHAEALGEAQSALLRSLGDRQARLDWLLELQRWFCQHRQGPDAMAYAMARRTATTSSIAAIR